jgi:hypothetical protein
VIVHTLDQRQTRRPVVTGAREYDADHPAVERRRRRAEQDVYRRPVAVLARAGGDSNVPVLDFEVMVGRRDEDDPLTQPLAVTRRPARQPPRPPEDVGEHARTAGGDVEHDADRRPQIRRQPSHHAHQNLDPAGGGANHDQVVPSAALRVDSIPFHMDSVRAVGGPHQLSRGAWRPAATAAGHGIQRARR